MSKLKRNLIYQYFYEVLAIILPLITTPIVTRNLGADGLGQYSYTYSIAVYFAMFAYLGMGNYGTREIACVSTENNKEVLSKTFWELFMLQLLLSVVIIVLYMSYLFIFVTRYKMLALIQILHLIATMINITWFYTGTEQFKITVTRNAIVKFFCAIIIILFVKSPLDIYLYAFTLLGSNLACNLIMFGFLKRNIYFVKPCMKRIIRHLYPNFILFVPVIASSIYTYMDKIMLGNIAGTLQTGYYEAMEKIVNVAIACVGAITTVMYPRVSAMIKEKSTKKIEYYIRVSFMAVSCFSFACIFGMAGVANIFVPLFFGEEFKVATKVFILGVIVLLPRAIRAVIQSEYLLPYGKDKSVIIAISSGAFSNIIANIILIQLYGAIGAIISTIFSDIVACIVTLISARKGLNIKKLIKQNIPYLFFGIIMYTLIVHMENALLMRELPKLLFLIFCGSLAYLLLSAGYIFILKKRQLI